MRICLLSDYNGVDDEGLRKIGHNFHQELRKRHDILHMKIRTLSRRDLWKDIRDFEPDILHFIPGPTIKCFAFVKLLSLYLPNCRTVMSAARPSISPILKWLVPLLKPNVLLTQSTESETMFAKLGCQVRFLPSGVDTKKFMPNNGMSKQELRKKYGLKSDNPTLLHVGSLTRRRNVALLGRIRKHMNVQVLTVSTSSIPVESSVERFLREADCHVVKRYIENMSEVYCAADCYIFPVMQPCGSIEMPLTVLEAMSCNIPVVSTRFGALPRLLRENGGFLYADSIDAFVKKVGTVLEKRPKVRNREKVIPYRWDNVARGLERIYNEALTT